MSNILNISRAFQPDSERLGVLEDVDYHPVIVLGEHRSGTTLLYQLLADTGCFNVQTAYHTMCYDRLLVDHAQGRGDAAREELNRRLDELGLRTRLVDNMSFDADYPEEYCFVLQPRSGRFRLTGGNRRLFDEMCRKIQFVSDSKRSLLLKNPFDYDNFVTVKRLLPSAKFVFIHRHPIQVMSSQLRMVRRNWAEGNPLNQIYSPIYARLQKSPAALRFMRWATGADSKLQPARRIIFRRTLKHANYFLDHVEELPASDFVATRYEDLCADPDGEMARILEFLSVDPGRPLDLKESIKPRPLQVLPEIRSIEDKILKDFRRMLSYHGYTSPAEG